MAAAGCQVQGGRAMGGDPMGRQWDVPGYTGVKVLGSGGFGEVVLARHDASGGLVAVKYLRRELLADAEFAVLFRAEAAVLASLDDPNVVRLYEYVESPAGAAIVMELIDGVSLRDILVRQGQTTAEAALVVLEGSLLGLAAAHRRGVVHRDYKPENVLINGDGASKLTDFGIAARAGDSPVPAGTLAYAPPEQFGGSPATPASDVYAATATFYECLTGRPPFTGDTAERLLYQHLSEPVPLEPVPEPLRPLVGAGLAKDPGARPADGAALVAELRAVAGWAYGPDWADRGRSGLAAAALLLAALWPSGGPATAQGSTVHRISLRRRLPHRRISMVKAAIAAAVVAAGTALAVVSLGSTSPAAANTPVLTGTWTGSYICSQGLTGLRLVIRAARDGMLAGTFSFYALPANPSVPSGEGTITGAYSATRTDIRPGRWIRQPPGYVLVGLIAGPPADHGTLLRGRVSNPGCSTFSVTKSLYGGQLNPATVNALPLAIKYIPSTSSRERCRPANYRTPEYCRTLRLSRSLAAGQFGESQQSLPALSPPSAPRR
jgi:Protein kinase domain